MLHSAFLPNMIWKRCPLATMSFWRGNAGLRSVNTFPKRWRKGILKSHLRFVDLQYVLWGNEKMGLASDVEVRQAYNSKKDVAFYTSSRIKHYSADAGSFFLFFPSDIHQPSVRGKGELVKSRKIVIKIEYVD